jgi:hypothetical protein
VATLLPAFTKAVGVVPVLESDVPGVPPVFGTSSLSFMTSAHFTGQEKTVCMSMVSASGTKTRSKKSQGDFVGWRRWRWTCSWLEKS